MRGRCASLRELPGFWREFSASFTRGGASFTLKSASNARVWWCAGYLGQVGLPGDSPTRRRRHGTGENSTTVCMPAGCTKPEDSHLGVCDPSALLCDIPEVWRTKWAIAHEG